jgi:hypothetical protein
LPFPASTLAVELVYVCGPELATNIFHVDGFGIPVSSTDVDDIATAFATWDAGIETVRQGSSVLSMIRVREVGGPGGPVHERPQSNAGTGTGDALPLQIAMVCTWRTASAGRRFRGRTYLPHSHTNALSDSGNGYPVWSNGAKGTVAAAADQLITDVSAIGGVLVVASAAGSVNTPITNGQVGSIPDTQRRRRSALSEVPFIG